MSIPPLVCSTPPPPDQCEDDKDHEDFDLSYSLSQDEDDYNENSDYNYGHFSSYNNFQSAPDNKPLEIRGQEITQHIETDTTEAVCLKYDSETQSESNTVEHNLFSTNDINENKLKCDEDTNIEDLNLKVDEEIECITSDSVQIETREPNTVNVKVFDIPCSSDNVSPCSDSNLSCFDINQIDTIDLVKELKTDIDAPAAQTIETIKYVVNVSEDIINDIVASDLYELGEPENVEETVIKLRTNQQTCDHNHSETQSIDDDFGDFDDYQSVTTKTHATSSLDKSDNPWQNDESKDLEFGNFAANFEDKKFCAVDNVILNSVPVNNVAQIKNEKESDNQFETDDDFGDFDDFQSSSRKTEANNFTVEDPTHSHELPVLNLQCTDNEHQVLERITKVLSTVFLEEISEPENDYEGKLESLLSETWRHLIETDERQPYIVNWNNSLGQKTLLKALCIDSRNILFGPKWGGNMPKYAANLSNAPLQPQKQASVPSSIVTQNEIVAEKPSSKPTTWNDPFTSDGQESCNTESEGATIIPGPTDLDVFEATASTKPDKIYSNTIEVQPLRQINLPDTHIYTPTDSEIPRSKTIHYDRGPTVLVPQVDNSNQIDTVNIPNTSSPSESHIDDNEYWEFQNFKSTSNACSVPSNLSNSQHTTSQENNFETATTVNAIPKPNIAYQTELLQPIRIEHSMPTLNWPDPGEVKEAYSDFQDLVSISSPPTETQDRSVLRPAELRPDHCSKNKLDSFTDLNKKIKVDAEITDHDSFSADDDFATFQSAQPSNIASQSFKSSFFENSANQVPSRHVTEYDNTSPKLDCIKSDTISFESTSRSKEALSQNVGFTSHKIEITNKSCPSSSTQMPTNLLQPTPASFSTVNTQNQQKSTQILQPLSLESYSQINWPSPGIDLQDLSKFNPVETLHSFKSDLSVSSLNKTASPIHAAKNTIVNQVSDDDVWGDFVSSKPKQSQTKKPPVFVDDDEWTDFISSPSVKPVNGLNTISLNVHTNSNIQKSVQNKFAKKTNQPPLDIPTLNYITPKSNISYNDKHFQNL